MTSDRVARVAAPLRVQVVDALRTAIVQFEYQPGERLREADLCARFEVSRTVIREALRQLESENLVTMIAHRGPVVACLSVDEAQELYELRQAVEGLAGALFAERATPDEAAALIDALDAVRGSNANHDLREQLAAKELFYAALFRGAHNSMIVATLRGIHARVQMLRGLSMSSPGRHQAAVKELEAITDAAAITRNPVKARAACERHVEIAGALAMAALRQRASESEIG